MAAIGWTDVEAVASGLSAVSPTAQMVILGLVNTTLKVSLLGGESGIKTRMARTYLAAHLGDLALRKGGASGTAGPVTSETISEDEIRIDYANAVAQNASALRETAYGGQFLTIVRNSGARAPFNP